MTARRRTVVVPWHAVALRQQTRNRNSISEHQTTELTSAFT